ncbi:hypothetical protein [Halovenus salina]|uniref:hypothetical protein n=1 Tax=Halovenus salina TaxID=1510225 RepID=UPI002260A7A4|nr:hypothetical protein [Halovenus salina]
MKRRTYLKSGATLAGAATVGVGSTQTDWGPIGNSQALLGGLGIIGLSFVAGGVAGWLGNNALEPSEKEFEEARKKELKARLIGDFREIKSRADSHLDTFGNVNQFIKEYVRNNVAFAIEEAAATGKSQSEAITAVEEEVDKSISFWLKRHVKEFEDIMTQLGRRATLLVDNNAEMLAAKGDDHSARDGEVHDSLRTYFKNGDHTTLTLPNGQTIQTAEIDMSRSGNSDPIASLTAAPEHAPVIRTRPESDLNAASIPIIDVKEWVQTKQDLEDLAESEKDNAADLVSQMFEPLKNDEVEISKSASARSVLEASENADNYRQAAGTYRSMSIPEAHSRCKLEVEGFLIEGILFRSVGGTTLPANNRVNPADTPGNIEIAGKISDSHPTYGPKGFEPMEITVNVARDGSAAGLADVAVADADSWPSAEGLKLSDTADEGGTATLAVDSRLEAVDVSIQHDGNLHHTTLDLSESSTFDVSFSAGTDNRANTQNGLLDYQLSKGDIVTGELTEPFQIVDIEDGSEALQFAEPTLITTDPEHNPQQTANKLRENYQKEKDARNAVDDAYDDATGGGVGLGIGDGGIAGKAKKLVAAVLGVMLGLVGINAATG